MSRGVSRALLIGITAGMRCFLAPAVLISGEPSWGRAAKITAAALALGELAADTTPYVGSRLDAGPLTGRVLAGAICGARIASQRRSSAPAGLVVGGIAAFASAHFFYYLRRTSTHSGIPDLAFALAEDAAAAGIASRACN